MRNAVVQFLKGFQKEIIDSFEALEKRESTAVFQKKPWSYAKGHGGGEMAVLRGSLFEKAAVNWSGIEGTQFPMSDGEGPFFATGVSLITHMKNPHAPTVHMNFRYIETEKRAWFAGGYDLSPMGISYPEDALWFHKVAKETLDPFDEALYPQFSANAKEYFFIPHRNKERGVGGLFFDHYNSGNPSQDFLLWKALASSFLLAILPIYEKRVHLPWSEEEQKEQYRLRGHYAEFNLVYDRGTKFGFLSGGNPEAILCSMPPIASW